MQQKLMHKDFDHWNEIKKSIEENAHEQERFPQEGEVWMCAFGRNIGFEQNGSGDSFSRPVLIIKKFNNQMFWSVPLSTKQKELDFYLNFIDPNSKRVSAILAQMKLVSVKRLKRRLYDIPRDFIDEMRTMLRGFSDLKIETPR